MSGESSISAIHVGFSAPEHVVFETVRRATGELPVSKTRVIAGYDSEVYFVQTKAKGRYVLKIRRRGEVTYQEEAWAIERCRTAGVPVPEVLLVDQVPLEEGLHEVMVQRRLDGRPFAQLEGRLSYSQVERFYVAAGEVLGRIHSVSVGGFYRRSPVGEWDFPSWEALAQSMVESRSQEREELLQVGITEEEFALLIGALETYRDRFDCPTPVLCHGDFLPEHLFVDEELRIVGVVDFGMYEGNHPVHDFAYIEFCSAASPLELLKRGYGNRALFDERFEQRLLLHQIAIEMGHLAHHARVGMEPEARFALGRLRKSLERLRRLG
ncbi:MAG: hypothetical protein KatS3mg115_2656 [Candidatus Poribacteria bacterium]|nr:MAG: hypothetical protein KatS3mg115_2656 [Candidatus Poribacteria bacterium]